MYHWISNWLTKLAQRVLVDGSSSNYVPVISGVPLGDSAGSPYVSQAPLYFSYT